MFERFAGWTSRHTGRPIAFALAVAVVVVWGLSGPLFGFSDTWQLIINTSTTVITFWMVFILQHTQDKDTKAMELKLDELLRVTKGTDHRLIGVEDSTEDALDQIKQRNSAAVE